MKIAYFNLAQSFCYWYIYLCIKIYYLLLRNYKFKIYGPIIVEYIFI